MKEMIERDSWIKPLFLRLLPLTRVSTKLSWNNSKTSAVSNLTSLSRTETKWLVILEHCSDRISGNSIVKECHVRCLLFQCLLGSDREGRVIDEEGEWVSESEFPSSSVCVMIDQLQTSSSLWSGTKHYCLNFVTSSLFGTTCICDVERVSTL